MPGGPRNRGVLRILGWPALNVLVGCGVLIRALENRRRISGEDHVEGVVQRCLFHVGQNREWPAAVSPGAARPRTGPTRILPVHPRTGLDPIELLPFAYAHYFPPSGSRCSTRNSWRPGPSVSGYCRTGPAGPPPRRLNGRKEQGDQNSDNGNHDQKLDQCEGPTCHAHTHLLKVHREMTSQGNLIRTRVTSNLTTPACATDDSRQSPRVRRSQTRSRKRLRIPSQERVSKICWTQIRRCHRLLAERSQSRKKSQHRRFFRHIRTPRRSF